MKSSMRKKLFALLLVCLLTEPILARRSGGGGSRGSSGARTSGGFGGSRSRAGSSASGGGYHPHNSAGSSYPRGNYGVGSHSNTGGGMFGGNRQNQNRQGGYNNNMGGSNSGGFFKSSGQSRPTFNKGSGLGSMVRSNTFKNAIVGAAAGYLLYQGGKHLIRSAMSPMMYGGRPYYWGQSYYQQRPGMQQCRMPIDSSDPQFGNVYFQDQTRPKEIVWSCSYNEVCCGYECCPGGGGFNQGGGYGSYGAGGYNQGYGNGFWGRNSGYRSFGFGSLLVLILISCCACAIVYKVCNRNRNTYQAANPPAYNAY